MRMITTLAILAPAALALSACGASEEEVTDTDFGMDSGNAATDSTEMPAVPANARSTVDFAGTYEQRSSDGRIRTVTLNTDDTYKMTDIEGVETTGTYSWYSDNSRILIKENGQNNVFAIADGAIYEMAGPDALTTGAMTEDQMFRKSLQIEY